MTTWEPDTCPELDKCALLVDPTWAVGAVVRKCAVHQNVADGDLFMTLYGTTGPNRGENQRKNGVEKEFKENPDLGFGQIAEDGSWEWKPGVFVVWNWTGAGASRVLRVTMVGAPFPAGKKAAAQNWCNTNFGAGKVVLE